VGSQNSGEDTKILSSKVTRLRFLGTWRMGEAG